MPPLARARPRSGLRAGVPPTASAQADARYPRPPPGGMRERAGGAQGNHGSWRPPGKARPLPTPSPSPSPIPLPVPIPLLQSSSSASVAPAPPGAQTHLMLAWRGLAIAAVLAATSSARASSLEEPPADAKTAPAPLAVRPRYVGATFSGMAGAGVEGFTIVTVGGDVFAGVRLSRWSSIEGFFAYHFAIRPSTEIGGGGMCLGSGTDTWHWEALGGRLWVHLAHLQWLDVSIAPTLAAGVSVDHSLEEHVAAELRALVLLLPSRCERRLGIRRGGRLGRRGPTAPLAGRARDVRGDHRRSRRRRVSRAPPARRPGARIAHALPLTSRTSETTEERHAAQRPPTSSMAARSCTSLGSGHDRRSCTAASTVSTNLIRARRPLTSIKPVRRLR